VIKLSHQKSGFFFSLHSGIDQLFDMVIKNGWISREATQQFEIIKLNGEKIVKTTLFGKCKFRLGISQKIEINEINI